MRDVWEIDEKLKIDGFIQVFRRDFSPGFVFQGETHDYWELFYVEEGNATVYADRQAYTLSDNEIILHKPGELHKFNITSEKKTRAFVMSFILSGSMTHRLENFSAKLSESQIKFLNNILYVINENEKEAFGSDYHSYIPPINIPKDDFYKEKSYFLQQLACSLELFLLSCLENEPTHFRKINSTESTILNKAMLALSENLLGWVSVSEIAQICSISESYLKKVFSKHIGIGIHKYFLNMKVEQSKDLLENGNTVAEVARIFNFSSQNYFSMVFKREIGMSPIEYKKAVKKASNKNKKATD